MKVQGLSVSFGNKTKYQDQNKGPNITGSIIAGGAVGATGGLIIRQAAPVKDDFFSQHIKENKRSKNEISNSIKNFVKDYGKQELEEARILNTAMQELAATHNIPHKQDTSNEIVKPIGKNDSKELQLSVRILKEDLTKELDNLPQKKKNARFKELSNDANRAVENAKRIMEAKTVLTKTANSLIGLGHNSKKSISEMKETLTKAAINHKKPVMTKISDGFSTMVHKAAKSQRKHKRWVAIPAVATATIAGAIAVAQKATSNKRT